MKVNNILKMVKLFCSFHTCSRKKCWSPKIFFFILSFLQLAARSASNPGRIPLSIISIEFLPFCTILNISPIGNFVQYIENGTPVPFVPFVPFYLFVPFSISPHFWVTDFKNMSTVPRDVNSHLSSNANATASQNANANATALRILNANAKRIRRIFSHSHFRILVRIAKCEFAKMRMRIAKCEMRLFFTKK